MKNKYTVTHVHDENNNKMIYIIDTKQNPGLSRADARKACKYLNDLNKAKQQAKKDKEYNNSWKHTRDMCS
jgi:hypothetical protein